jgi:transposase
VHIAVDTLGHLPALKVTAAGEQERAQVAELTARVREVTGGAVGVEVVDQGYTGETAAGDARGNGIRLGVVRHTEAKKGFVLLPRRWVVERSFAWLARFRRLARYYERLTETLAGWHWLAFLTLLLPRLGLNSA